MTRWSRLGAYAWASPNTLLGLLAGLIAFLLGARVSAESHAIAFSGGHVGRWLDRLPPELRFSAMTLGHVILAVNSMALTVSREHELVHVGQYERWGPFFLPAYLLSSLWQILRGRRAYWDNHFERQAFLRAPGP
jgi:hypothetical protein